MIVKSDALKLKKGSSLKYLNLFTLPIFPYCRLMIKNLNISFNQYKQEQIGNYRSVPKKVNRLLKAILSIINLIVGNGPNN